MSMEALEDSSHSRGNESQPIQRSCQQPGTGSELLICGVSDQSILLPDVEATTTVGVTEAARDDRQAAATYGNFGLLPEERMVNQLLGVVGQPLESVVSKMLLEDTAMGFQKPQQDLGVVVVEQRERSDPQSGKQVIRDQHRRNPGFEIDDHVAVIDTQQVGSRNDSGFADLPARSHQATFSKERFQP